MARRAGVICCATHRSPSEAGVVTRPGAQQWVGSILEDPRLTLTPEDAMADLQTRATAYVRRRCPDHAGLILDMLGLGEVTT